MLGVLISPPKHPQSENPKSSATITRKLGRVGAMVNGFDFIVLRSRHYKGEESSLPIAWVGSRLARRHIEVARASKANHSHQSEPLTSSATVLSPHLLLFLVVRIQLQLQIIVTIEKTDPKNQSTPSP